MKKIMLWGLGKYSDIVFASLKSDMCELVGAIDINEEKQGVLWKNKFEVISPEKIPSDEIDYIIVTVLHAESIQKQINEKEIEESKVIYFWHQDVSQFEFINPDKKEIFCLKMELEKYKNRADNAPYEFGEYTGPIIKSSVELLELIREKKASLCRFGDGEFEIIFGNNRSWFQKPNNNLGERLRNILNSEDSNIIIAIADNYGNLDKYTEEAADAIRSYLSVGKRKQHMDLLNLDRIYYDAYVSRSYMMYKDKDNARKIFELYGCIFEGRNILIVEGQHTKSGYKNDLFANAKKISRILCPDCDAYLHYEEIYNSVIKNADKETLIIISLGATATVLAYDLAREGYQALDFGQMDNEYEWYKRKCSKKEVIPGKSVSEISWYKYPKEDELDFEFRSQVICEVGINGC